MQDDVKEFSSLAELLNDLDKEEITGIERARSVENFLMRKSRLRGRPYCATFELTPLCNFDCKMCYVHLTREQMQLEGRMLTVDEWMEVARQTVEMGVRHIDLTGGECLTYPGFEVIYTYLIEQGIHVSVLTNGQLIDDKYIELFKKFKPSVVQISLYGSNSEAYIRVTGRAGFDDVMRAIGQLREAGIHVCLSVTPHRYMQDDAEKMLNLLHTLNVDYTIGSATLPARPETGRNIAEYAIDLDEYIKICQLEAQYRNEVAKRLALKPKEPYRFKIKGQHTLTGPSCAAGTSNFHINWKGEMMPCAAFYSVRCSVLDKSLENAWNWIHDTMQKYRLPEECLQCDLLDVCAGCTAEKTSGKLTGPINPYVCRRMRISATRRTATITNESPCGDK